MRKLSLEHLFDIISSTLNNMDKRLTGHGERVAYAMLLLPDFGLSPDEACRLTWTVLFHDIGSFSEHGIKDLMKKENNESFSHARYGYLFLKAFSPFPEFAPVVRYHHSGHEEIDASDMDDTLKWASKCLQVLDIADLFLLSHIGASEQDVAHFLLEEEKGRFDSEVVEASLEVLGKLPKFAGLSAEDVHKILFSRLGQMEVSEYETELLLRTLVSSIDFRSHATALHCSTVTKAADLLAEYSGLSADERDAVHLGAMLHDLGKTGIPTRILDSRDKLNSVDWKIMRSHVDVADKILRGRVDDDVLEIALRHHEKLDGTGYPRGLHADDLTLPQRIVAVADIASALCTERSYKPAFPLERAMAILEDMSAKGQICPETVAVFEAHKEEIYDSIHKAGLEAEKRYVSIFMEYCLSAPRAAAKP